MANLPKTRRAFPRGGAEMTKKISAAPRRSNRDEKLDKDFPLLTLHSRLRIAGTLSHSERGPLLLTKAHVAWVIETTSDISSFVGCNVVVEGTKTAMDRIAADYVGKR